MERVDVVVVGGGPAGMSAALVLGRARLRTVVVNAEAPRNAASAASHGFLTRDGAHASELLEVAKAQLRPYDAVRYVVGYATAERADDGFAVRAAGEAWLTRRLIVASGYRDDLTRLGLPGIEAVYGRSVFPCPFCDGFEHADERLAVFGAAGMEHFVPVVRVWSADVHLFTNGRGLEPDAMSAFDRAGVPVHTDRVVRLDERDGRLVAVTLADGRRIARDAGFIGDDCSEPATDIVRRMGVSHEQSPWGMEVPVVEEGGATSVDGLYVVGDARSGFGGIPAAVQEGSACASQIVHEVAMERWQRQPDVETLALA